MQDESNAAIRDKKKERNQNSKAHSENRRLSQSVREMIRAKKVEDARRACEEQVPPGCSYWPLIDILSAEHSLQHTSQLSAFVHVRTAKNCVMFVPRECMLMYAARR